VIYNSGDMIARMLHRDIRTTPARVAFTGIRTTLRRFFVRVTCRGDSGRRDKAQDISDYASNSGGNVLATTSQPIGCPDGMNLSEATSKKARVHINSVSCMLYSAVRLVHKVRPLQPAIKVRF